VAREGARIARGLRWLGPAATPDLVAPEMKGRQRAARSLVMLSPDLLHCSGAPGKLSQLNVLALSGHRVTEPITRAGVALSAVKRATPPSSQRLFLPHLLRHSFAKPLLEAGWTCVASNSCSGTRVCAARASTSTWPIPRCMPRRVLWTPWPYRRTWAPCHEPAAARSRRCGAPAWRRLPHTLWADPVGRRNTGPCGPLRCVAQPHWRSYHPVRPTVGTRSRRITPAANRSCPTCHGAAQATWLALARARCSRRPTSSDLYLPHDLGPLALQNPRHLYGRLFHTVAQALQDIAQTPKHLVRRSAASRCCTPGANNSTNIKHS